MDTLPEEQKAGYSVMNSVFSMKKEKIINIFDTPGRPEFIFEAISAVMVSDVAVFVLDCSVRKHLDSKVFSPTKNIAYLARAFGITNSVVFLNKADRIGFDSNIIHVYEEEAKIALKGAGLKLENLKFLIGSSLQPDFSDEVITKAEEFPRGVNECLKPLRLIIDDRYRLVHGTLLGYCITGFIASGLLQTGKTILILQGKLQGKVKEILKGGEKVKKAMAGD